MTFAVASSESALDVHSSIVIPPVESGSEKATVAQAFSLADSVMAVVVGSSVERETSVNPKRAVNLATEPVACAHRLIVGGVSESAVAGAVAAVETASA